MKTLLVLLLVSGYAYAQAPTKSIRRDSLPEIFPPDLMPNARPNNSFYRDHRDPKNVMRSTLDNMPIKVPDSSTNYTMLHSFRNYGKPSEPPMQFLKPVLPILPKKH